MAQGLAMFDVNQRLIICNQRFLDLYNLPAVMAQPGTELTDILDHTARVEKLLPEQAKTLRQRRLATAASGEEATLQDFLSNGRVIRLVHRPMTGCRSEERRVGKECVRKGRTRVAPIIYKK